MKVSSAELNTLTASFVLTGRVIVRGRCAKVMPKRLGYNGNVTARGEIRGQIGPTPDFKLGW